MTAAAARKLQKEIDVVLKKVDDGICEFSDCWEQATAAGSTQQKEKLGEELKRSINKLQRFRVQIREWLAQSGVATDAKDKLEEARKRVENDMQRFKDFERDLKTKAFSTCALARGDELALEEEEKIKYQEWLTGTIQSLNDQLDEFEADLEMMANKKSLSSDDKARQAQLSTLSEQHRWHIKKLEQVLRGVDNDAIEISDVTLVRDSIDFYVENNQEPDCYVDESLFDGFDLADYEDKAPPPKSPCESVKAQAVSTPGSTSGKEDSKSKAKDKEKRRKDEKKDKKKEEREKKNAAPKAAGTSKSSAKGSPSVEGNGSAEVSREQAELDEIKVQEDQLLSEAAEFICKICQIHVAGCGPKLTSCSHLFCGDCIAQWFNQHPDNQTWAQRARSAGPDRVVPCPVCKQPLNEKRDLYPVCGVTSRSENLLLWRMLSSLKIVCANHVKVRPDGKCDWVGEYGSYQKHAAICKNVPLGDLVLNTPEPSQNMGRSMSIDSDMDGSGRLSRNDSVKSIPTPSPSSRATPVQSPKMAPQKPAITPDSSSAGIDAASGYAEKATSASPFSRTLDVRSPPAQQAAEPPAPFQSLVEVEKPSKAAQAPLSPAPTTLPSTSFTEIHTPQASATSAAIAGAALAAQPPKVATQAASTVANTSNAPANGGALAESTSTAQRHTSLPDKARDPAAEGVFTAHAVSTFEGTSLNTVSVHAGDLISVLEQHSSGWTYAKNLSSSSPSNFGWIPSWIVPATPPAEEVKEVAPPQPKPQAPVVVQPAPQQAAPPPQQVQAAPVPAAAPAPTLEARPVIRASSTFAATSPSQLTLTPADCVEVVERHASGWTYGRKVTDSRGEGAVEGWFPDWVVAQK